MTTITNECKAQGRQRLSLPTLAGMSNGRQLIEFEIGQMLKMVENVENGQRKRSNR